MTSVQAYPSEHDKPSPFLFDCRVLVELVTVVSPASLRTVMFALRPELYTLYHTVGRSRSESIHRTSLDIDLSL